MGAFEAKTHLSQLLEEVSQGEEVLITRHGHALARLVPHNPSQAERRQAAIARLRRFRRGKRLDGLSLQQLRDAGRRR